jgi:hypothetical protein
MEGVIVRLGLEARIVHNPYAVHYQMERTEHLEEKVTVSARTAGKA